jgi:peptidoglycan hydrolase-like protein with peptidoglycan-binding domain
VIYDFERACQASLERSRARRSAVAQRLAALRRRRRRGGGSSVAVLGAVLALGGPLALAQTSAQAPAPSMLSAGSSGNAVAALQAALGIKQTGSFSAATARAVRAFQRNNGLTVDGIVGPQTAGALGLASGPVASAPKAVTASSGGGSATLARIARCESGGDPGAISADGRYRGKYQFTRATWRAMGGNGDPAAAPEAEQDQRAAALLAEQGTAPWPACGLGR